MAQENFTASNEKILSLVGLPDQQVDVSTTIAETAQPLDAAQLDAKVHSDNLAVLGFFGAGLLLFVGIGYPLKKH